MVKHLHGIILFSIFVIESLTKPTSHDHADRHHRRFFPSLFGGCSTGRNNTGFKSSTMKTSRREFMLEMQRHHFARLAMMEAEERGENLEYEEALELTKYHKS